MRSLPLLCGLALLSACGSSGRGDAGENSTGNAMAPSNSAETAPELTNSASEVPVDKTLIGPDGFGPFRIGESTLTVATAHKLEPLPNQGTSCEQASVPKLGGTTLTFRDEHLARIDLVDRYDAGTPPTAKHRSEKGAKIGTSVAELKQMYGDALIERPDLTKGDGNPDYLVLSPTDPTHGLLFRTMGGSVASIAAGEARALGGEGCS